jgi:hypothetical protein
MAEGSPHHRADVVVTHADGSVTLKVPDGSVTLTENEALELAGRLAEAQARASGEDPEERDWVRIPMQYIRAAAERLEDAEPDAEPGTELYEELKDAKAAEVHCWIANQTQQNAMHVAAGWIASHGWVVTEVIEQAPVTRDDFEGTDYLPYYEQALTDSEVFLYEIDEAETDETEGSSDAS